MLAAKWKPRADVDAVRHKVRRAIDEHRDVELRSARPTGLCSKRTSRCSTPASPASTQARPNRRRPGSLKQFLIAFTAAREGAAAPRPRAHWFASPSG